MILEVLDVFESTWFTNRYGEGKHTTAFEKSLAEKVRQPFCCLYGAGTPELLSSMMHLNKLFDLEKQVKRSVGFKEFPGPWAVFVDEEKDKKILKQLGSGGYNMERRYEFEYLGINIRPTEVMSAALEWLLRTGRLTLEELQ